MRSSKTLLISFLALALSAAVLFSAPVPAAEAQQGGANSILFLVDTSGSMQGTRLSAAKTALSATVSALAATNELGLRPFAGSCNSPGQLLIPVGPTDEQAFLATVNGLSAGGGTPTSAALLLAATEIPAGGTIVLIADGDDQCGDLCTTATSLVNQGISLTIQTVGVQVSGGVAAQMQCAANVTGGQYFDVSNPADLTDALTGATSCGADPVVCYAPEVRFHPSEGFYPMDASDFVTNSELKWAADVSCGDFTIEDSPTVAGLTNGAYGSYESDASLRWSWDFRCGPQTEGRWYESSLFTRPFADIATNTVERPLKSPGQSAERLEDTEGFYLDWLPKTPDQFSQFFTGPRGATPTPDPVDGRGRVIDAPVYFEQTADKITYWFFYGYDPKADATLDNPVWVASVDQFLAHEGDWERVEVNLTNGQPESVFYFGHGCTPPTIVEWAQVEKADGTHPVVYSSEGSHASYPVERGSGDALCGTVKGFSDVTVYDEDTSAVWRSWTGIGPIASNTQCWYGYGGAWGVTGNFTFGRTHDTGPAGPPYNGTVIADGPAVGCTGPIGNLLGGAIDNLLGWIDSILLQFENGTPGTAMTVSLASVATVLGEAVVGPDGSTTIAVTIPPGTPPGSHHLVIQDSATGETLFTRLIWVQPPAECIVEQSAPGIDADGDHIIDRCDPNPLDGATADFDGDGIANAVDNCSTIFNPDQATDRIGRSVGAACDERLAVNTVPTHQVLGYINGPFCGYYVPTIYGTAGDDNITGTNGLDVIWAGPGNDIVDGRNGDDVLCGDDGDDVILGGNGHDVLLGGSGADVVDGENGTDDVSGGEGDDEVRGGNGPDTLSGGEGDDLLDGGAGPDTGDAGPGANQCVAVEAATNC